MQPIEKRCTRCGEAKLVSSFSKDRSRRDGLDAHCRDCKKRRHRSWYEKNAEKVKASSKAWREANREAHLTACRDWYEANREKSNQKRKRNYQDNIDREKASRKRWRNENVERCRANMKAWADPRRDELAEYARNWRKENPERAKAYTMERRARLKEATIDGSVTSDFLAELRTATHCAYCAEEVGKNPHIDHVVPLCKGGTHTADNLVLACAKCNLTKQGRHPSDFGWPIGWE